MTKQEILLLIKNNQKQRYCKGCDSYLSLSEFYIKKDSKKPNSYRFNSPCKSCSSVISTARKEYQRNYHLKLKYNITSKEYEEILKKQNNCCAICGIHETEVTKKLAVDHDHKTLKIRGLLCPDCNIGLGYFRDSKKLLKAAINYL